MAGLTYFGLEIDVFIKNLIIFIKKKYFKPFFRISFNKLLKGTTILITTTVSPKCCSGLNEGPASDTTSKWARNPNYETKQILKLKKKNICIFKCD